MLIDYRTLEKGFWGTGIELDASEFEGKYDHVFVRAGTKTHVILTKYKVKDDSGKTLPIKEWKMKVEYNKEWGTKLYRDEKLKNLLCLE